jgi:TonB family protein
MMKLAATSCTALAILLFSSANGTAAGAATVSGTITDASGAMVPTARLLLTPVGEGKTYAATSNEVGSWELRSVAAGEYTLEVRRPGFAAYRQRMIVPEDKPVQLDVRLSVGMIEENLNVQGQGLPQPSAAPRPAGMPSRISIGGNVQAAKLLRQPRPAYPPHLKSAGITGLVVLQAVIGREGDIIRLESIAPDVHPDLVEAATAAVQQWKYQPTLLNGVPVEVVTVVNVNFSLAP